MRDPYLAARIDDIRVVGSRLIRNLMKKPYVAYSGLTGGAIILAEEVTPADTALMDPRRIGGFATEFGGPDSHTAIMARALGLPAVLAVAGLLERARADADGGDRRDRRASSSSTRRRRRSASIAARREELTRERRHLARLRRLPAVTRDGIEIRLEANLELPVELEQALANGAMGLGLVRTEFLYMNREDLPSEDEQYEFFASLVRGMDGRPVTLRTLDVGGDKIAGGAGRLCRAEAANPALGLRAIRLSLKERRLLDPQLAAMLRAAQRRAAAHPVADDLDGRRDPPRPRGDGAGRPPAAPPRRADPRNPAAARRDDRGAGRGARRRRAGRRSRFLRDRHQRSDPVHAGDRPQRRAGRASLQPAAPGGAAPDPVRRRGGGAPRASRSASAARWPATRAIRRCCSVSGLRELSMSPRNIPRVKQRIRSLDMVAATRRARAIMDQSDPAASPRCSTISTRGRAGVIRVLHCDAEQPCWQRSDSTT